MWFALSLVPAVLYFGLLFGAFKRLVPLEHAAAVQTLGRQGKLITAGTVVAGAILALPVELGVRSLGVWLGTDPKAQVTGAFGSMLATLLLFAPLEEGAKAAALWPLRSRWLHRGREGAVLGTAIAIGFASVEVALYLRTNLAEVSLDGRSTGPPGLLHAAFALAVARAACATVARVFAGATWGYALARATSRLGGARFWVTWTAATALRGLYDHLVFGRGLAALLGSMPLLVGMIGLAYAATRGLVSPAPIRVDSSGRPSLLASQPPPPSFRAMRDALRRAEQPVMLHWIALGSLVTMGVIISCVAAAVVAGRRAGIDFGAVDEGEVTGALPLALVGVAVLFAFLVSGYLVARASGAESVLEPAFAAALAIAATLVLLGLAAPVAVVFAVAFAPVALGLACAGAWVGIGSARR
jgi:RsiW-degrading membrane proteinase PrsW (M82 family)